MTTSPENTFICSNCIDEAFLKRVAEAGASRTCAYCSSDGSCLSIRQLSDKVKVAFEQHYERTETEPDGIEQVMHLDKDTDYWWDRDGAPAAQAISEAARIPPEAAFAVRDLLADDYFDHELAQMGVEGEFDEGSYYAECGPDADHLRLGWLRMEHSLRQEARLFNSDALSRMEHMFKGIDSMSTEDGEPVVRLVGPSTSIERLNRARVFQSYSELCEALCRPDIQLGPPPQSRASAGRMNCVGVSVFYGATDDATALAEVRPPVGSSVVVAQFRILRPLRVLDLEAARKVWLTGSIFDPEHTDQLERATFLKELSSRLTRAVMPVDELHDYIPSQAVADYLATQHSPRIDGIIYRSVQARGDGRNIILFHHAARVEPLDIPEGAHLDADRVAVTEEDPGYFMVIERLAKARPADSPTDDFAIYLPPDPFDVLNEDGRDTSLALVEESATVHTIEAVSLKSTTCKVTRQQVRASDDEEF